MIRIRYISDIINVHRPIFITAGNPYSYLSMVYQRERERERRGRGGWMDGQTDIDIQMTYTFTLKIVLSRTY